MKRLTALLLAASGLVLAACVTINVYFPAAAAQAAADRVIDEVWGGSAAPAPAAPAPAPDAAPTSWLERPAVHTVARAMLDFVVPVARADEPNLDVSSPEIQRLTDSMESRFPELSPYYASGAVGLVADGFIVVRDGNLVPLPERNKVRTLVANENADRAALYHELAAANGQPQWEAQIRGVFAKRWIARAKAGWFVQDGSTWKQK